jgi:hypothetical protein
VTKTKIKAGSQIFGKKLTVKHEQIQDFEKDGRAPALLIKIHSKFQR